MKQKDLMKKGKRYCNRCNKVLSLSKFFKRNKLGHLYKPGCRDCHHKSKQIRNRITKMKFVLGYGGKCQCCGEKRIEFLTLDHIYHDRKTHRKTSGGGSYKPYKDLINRKFPKDKYRVLCINCNWAVRYDTPCPHSKEYKAYIKEIEAIGGAININGLKDLYFDLKKKLKL